MSEQNPTGLIEFLAALHREELTEFQFEADDALLAAISQLKPEDASDLILVMAGRQPANLAFYEDMRDKGWAFVKDNDPSHDGIYGTDRHGFPFIGAQVEMPGGILPATLPDLARALESDERTRELFLSPLVFDPNQFPDDFDEAEIE